MTKGDYNRIKYGPRAKRVRALRVGDRVTYTSLFLATLGVGRTFVEGRVGTVTRVHGYMHPHTQVSIMWDGNSAVRRSNYVNLQLVPTVFNT